MVKLMGRRRAPRKPAGGRPPKFAEPSHPVTITLPDRILDQLHRIDGDRAKAIVKAVDRVLGAGGRGGALRRVELVKISPTASILMVPSNRSLRRIPWLQMIEVAPNRHLLAIDSGTPIEKVELGLLDLIENARSSGSDEVELLEALRETIGTIRRGQRISKAEILVIAREGAPSRKQA